MSLLHRLEHIASRPSVDAVEQGITAVSAPVLGADGQPLAAISIVGPSFRLNGALLDRARHAVAGTAARLQVGQRAADDLR